MSIQIDVKDVVRQRPDDQNGEDAGEASDDAALQRARISDLRNADHQCTSDPAYYERTTNPAQLGMVSLVELARKSLAIITSIKLASSDTRFAIQLVYNAEQPLSKLKRATSRGRRDGPQ